MCWCLKRVRLGEPDMQVLALLLSTCGMPASGRLLCSTALLCVSALLPVLLLLGVGPCRLPWLRICARHHVTLRVRALLVLAISIQLPVPHAGMVVARLLVAGAHRSAICRLCAWHAPVLADPSLLPA